MVPPKSVAKVAVDEPGADGQGHQILFESGSSERLLAEDDFNPGSDATRDIPWPLLGAFMAGAALIVAGIGIVGHLYRSRATE